MSMIRPERVFIRVVLPALLEPMTPTISPSSTFYAESQLSASAFSKKDHEVLNIKHSNPFFTAENAEIAENPI